MQGCHANFWQKYLEHPSLWGKKEAGVLCHVTLTYVLHVYIQRFGNCMYDVINIH
jgi:hypothetical protein